MDSDAKIEQQAIKFLSYLGIKSQSNFFTCYRYPLPILGIIPFKAVVQAMLVKVNLLVFTPNELVIKKVGSGFSLVKIKEKSFDRNVIRIPKKQIKRFEIKNWVVLGMSWGYLMTIEADKTYYFNVAKTIGEDFSTRNFFNVKKNNFYGLVTEDKTNS
ncbi:hypothetical protein [Enterococcus canintestini]|uniref:Uncharacterized protein n=1 Tax=Enterococcus canintestini TaxID=317010 RepID=A0A1L8R8D8_9ENTE|nr:hypothetical protein [Enterococcus canintestini]OJG16031.1 hypothetical protein RU96_GL001528 [Enterococcus canintestini]